jgi:hypothetical protein
MPDFFTRPFLTQRRKVKQKDAKKTNLYFTKAKGFPLRLAVLLCVFA